MGASKPRAEVFGTAYFADTRHNLCGMLQFGGLDKGSNGLKHRSDVFMGGIYDVTGTPMVRTCLESSYSASWIHRHKGRSTPSAMIAYVHEDRAMMHSVPINMRLRTGKRVVHADPAWIMQQQEASSSTGSDASDEAPSPLTLDAGSKSAADDKQQQQQQQEQWLVQQLHQQEQQQQQHAGNSTKPSSGLFSGLSKLVSSKAPSSANGSTMRSMGAALKATLGSMKLPQRQQQQQQQAELAGPEECGSMGKMMMGLEGSWLSHLNAGGERCVRVCVLDDQPWCSPGCGSNLHLSVPHGGCAGRVEMKDGESRAFFGPQLLQGSYEQRVQSLACAQKRKVSQYDCNCKEDGTPGTCGSYLLVPHHTTKLQYFRASGCSCRLWTWATEVCKRFSPVETPLPSDSRFRQDLAALREGPMPVHHMTPVIWQKQAGGRCSSNSSREQTKHCGKQGEGVETIEDMNALCESVLFWWLSPGLVVCVDWS
eukprot:1137243-Pelagomonas_calceolata.AAC.3